MEYLNLAKLISIYWYQILSIYLLAKRFVLTARWNISRRSDSGGQSLTY